VAAPFVLDVNLRIKDIVGLKQVQTAITSAIGSASVGGAGGVAGAVGGVAAAGSAGAAVSAAKNVAVAATTQAAAIEKVSKANTKLAATSKKASSAVNQAAGAQRRGAKAADDFGHSVGLAAKRYAAFLTATVVPFAALGGLSKATAAVIEFDGAILKLRQIMGQTTDEVSGLRDTILNLSTATGTSASELAGISKTMAQAGFRGEQLNEALGALAKVPLTPSFENVSTAVEGTIAAINQFNKEGLKTEEILDVMTALSNKYAASAEDIAIGVARGGAAFEAIGGTFREFAAAFTTVRQATRESASTVGTFFKTISSRLADPKIIDFLTGKGIKLVEEGQFVGAIEGFRRIADALKDITNVQDRVAILTQLGGRRQFSRLAALSTNIDTLDNALITAGDSAGEFGRVAEEGLSGLQAQLNILGQEFNRLVQTLAEPLFIPLIQSATQAGHAFVTMLDFIKPVIPALTAVIGFTAGMKALALAATGVGKAMAFLTASTVGLPQLMAGLTGGLGAGAGGAAGVSARQRVQNRLGGGVGLGVGQAAAAGAGARLAGGAKAVAGNQIAQMAALTGLFVAADALSTKFEETGGSAGIMAAEFAKAAVVIVGAAALISGKSLQGLFASLAGFLGPVGLAAAGVTAAFGALAYAGKKAVDFDIKQIEDAMIERVKSIELTPIDVDEAGGLSNAINDFSDAFIKDIQGAAGVLDESFWGRVGTKISKIFDLDFAGVFTGPIIDEGRAREMIETMIGANPERFNQIMAAAIEQFGVAGLEAGLVDIGIADLFKDVEDPTYAANLFTDVIIKMAGGLREIAKQIPAAGIPSELDRLATAAEKVTDDISKIHVPVRLSGELETLSEAVSRAAASIQTNVDTFDAISQTVGGDIGLPSFDTEWDLSAIEELARAGRIGEVLDLSQFEDIAGATTNLAQVGDALDLFFQSLIKSEAASADFAKLEDIKVSPIEIMDEYIAKFIDEYPDKIPPQAIEAFRVAAATLGTNLQTAIIDSSGNLVPKEERIAEALKSVLGQQTPFTDAAIKVYKQWLDAQSQQIKLRLEGFTLAADVDVRTAELGSTISRSFQKAYKNTGNEIDSFVTEAVSPLGTPFTLGSVSKFDRAMVNLARDTSIAENLLSQYDVQFRKFGEQSRRLSEQRRGLIPVEEGLEKATAETGVEVLRLQHAMELFEKVIEKAPESLRRIQEEYTKELGGEDVDITWIAKNAERTEREFDQMAEMLNRSRQKIEASVALDVGQVFEEPAMIFAKALRESSDAVKVWTAALTPADIERGLGGVDKSAIKDLTEPRKPQFDRGLAQSAVLGANIETSMGVLADTVRDYIVSEQRMYSPTLGLAEEEQKQVAAFEALTNSLYDVPQAVKDAGLSMNDLQEITQIAAKKLQEMSEATDAPEIDYLGAKYLTPDELAKSLMQVIQQPDILTDPQRAAEQLPIDLVNTLESISSQIRQPEVAEPAAPRVFENIEASATQIGQAANDTKIAADTMRVSTDTIGVASSDIITGGQDILLASQNFQDGASQLQAIIDVQKEAQAAQQEAAGDGSGGDVSGGGITTDAILALGEKVDGVKEAIQEQQKQEEEAQEEVKPIEIEGLTETTDALAANTEVASQTKEGMDELNKGMTQVADAMEEGVGIDVQTMSEIKVDVQGVADAAEQFTAEFEAVATRVVQEEIRVLLNELARRSGSTEMAGVFEGLA